MELALPESWGATLDALARAHQLPLLTLALAPALREVSDAYNGGNFRLVWTPSRVAARLHFFLPRDQTKLVGALRDVEVPSVWLGPGAALRVVDVGAGIGASALGAVRWLRMSGVERELEIVLLDVDGAALRLARAVLMELPSVTVRADSRAPEAADMVLFSNVLVEVPDAESRSAWVQRALESVGVNGLVVVVEPALHGPTRRLMGLRDGLVSRGHFVVAPCTHGGACPMLAIARDWCHEDVAVDLPSRLQPLARAAGLRWQGLTFSRLILANAPVPRPQFRVVAPPRDSRGRNERLLCGGLPDGRTLAWVDRLERHGTPGNVGFAEAERGDGLWIEGMPGTRVGGEAVVMRAQGSAAPQGAAQGSGRSHSTGNT